MQSPIYHGRRGAAASGGASWITVPWKGLSFAIAFGFLGYFFLPRVVPLRLWQAAGEALGIVIAPADVPLAGAAAGALVGAVIGLIVGLRTHAADTRRVEGYRRAAMRLGGRYSPAPDPELTEDLRPFFSQREFLIARNTLRARDLVVADLTTVRASSRRNRDRRTTQTVALRRADTARFPHFVLQPEGLMTNLLERIGGIEDIDFREHPGFSKAYHLSSTNAEATRRLFGGALLDLLARRAGLYIEGKGDRLLLYRPATQCEGENVQAFITEATEIFRALEESALRGGMNAEAPPPAAETTEQFIERLPAFAREHVRQVMVTREQADAFARQPPPRKVPPNILGHLTIQAPGLLIALGFVFGIVGVGLVLHSLFALASSQPKAWIPGMIGLVFTAIGVPMFFLTLRARRRIMRLLRLGQVGAGRILKCEPTGTSVNEIAIYEAVVQLSRDGRMVEARARLSGPAVERVRKRAGSSEPAPLLYDPADPSRVMLVDALVTTMSDG